ncbi:MAG: hypothetical protein IJ037_10380 [Clostridia bacterium]|nr:hypothetical protein [Clostridia bacterium]MBQ8369595.1 hypothetical protein [Clostridia bacterium]MBQ8511474.1 hypothetical protein [Clostridia bacterium]
MEHNRIVPVLALVLAAACIVMTLILISVSVNMSYLPEKSVDDIIAYLDSGGISIDRELITARRQSASVYVCDSPEYNTTVAELLDGGSVRSVYATPEGEVLIMSGGARLEFGDSFAFRYYRSGAASESPAGFAPSGMEISDAKREDVSATVVRFLDRGSREFDELNVETAVETVWESGGRYYALCSRSIDGIEIAGNLVLCTVEGDAVTEAYGTWCFLTPAETYSAQLSDLLNILFNVKKDLGGRENAEEDVTVTAVQLCYSLYFYGEEESFCLIPCWQIVTDTAGELIYNAIDSTLYTVK